MKMHEEKQQILGNTGQGTGFTIAATSKAFQILSSGIYKYKIRAIVREVICNANDAHIISNNQHIPFDIKAPNELDPRFIVRDYGPGLDDEDMMSIYTQYFASTKADCNEQTGAFGLGAKSPFSYTDTFTVASYHTGRCTIYNAMLSDGEPQLVRVYEGEMVPGEKHGIEVTVPVKPDDISEWQNELVRILRPFSANQYQLRGASELEITHLNQLPEYNDDWFQCEKHPNVAGKRMIVEPGGVYAVYGSIVYPLTGTPGMDASWLTAKKPVTYIHFPLGDLLPQPSREELQHDKNTVKNICDRVNGVNQKKMDEDIAALHAITCKRELLRQIHALPSNQYQVLEHAQMKFLGMTIAQLNMSLSISQMYQYLSTDGGQSVIFRCDSYDPRRMKLINEKSQYKRMKVNEVDLAKMFAYTQKEIWVLIQDDKASKLRPTVKGMTLSNDPTMPDRYDYMIVLDDDAFSKEQLAKIQEVMGEDKVHIHRVSELEETRKLVEGYGVKNVKPREKRPQAPNAEVSTYDPNKGWDTKLLYLTTNEIAELEGPVVGLYRDLASAKCFGFASIANISQYGIRDILQKEGCQKIYFVRPAIYQRVLKNPKLYCAFKEMMAIATNKLTAFPEDKHSWKDSGTFASNVIGDKRLSARIYPMLSGARDKEAVDINWLFDKVKQVRVFGGKSIAEMHDAVSLFQDRQEAARVKYLKKKDAFRAKHPTIFYVLDNKYSISDEMVDDILRILGPK